MGRRCVPHRMKEKSRLWDARAGHQIGPPFEGHTASENRMSFSPGGRRVVSKSCDKTLRLCDTDTCTQIGDPFEGHSDAMWCVSVSETHHTAYHTASVQYGPPMDPQLGVRLRVP